MFLLQIKCSARLHLQVKELIASSRDQSASQREREREREPVDGWAFELTSRRGVARSHPTPPGRSYRRLHRQGRAWQRTWQRAAWRAPRQTS